ncbi:hypothetical protein LCGC14_1604870, partial [marine sediment metagenome]
TIAAGLLAGDLGPGSPCRISRAAAAEGLLTPLRARGYAVLPTPRKVELRPGSVRLDAGWRLQTPGLDDKDIAVRTLIDALKREHGLALARGGDGRSQKVLRLRVSAGAVKTGAKDDRHGQAYRIVVAPGSIEVVGNAPPGLFYGVQTLLQLLEGDGRDRARLPVGTITDWPGYELRFVHWDTKHHQDRVETLERFLDQMAAFKLNMVSFELEDKFHYPSHPIIGAPTAFTTEQMQRLVRYALDRHIQIVPNVQAPAHLTYVLKHKQFAHLRCDGSNYQSCMDNPEVRKLIFDMYDDLCRATKGVKYFHVSTDEVYYAGICQKYRKPYNPKNRSLTWVDFVKAAHAHLAKRGRRIIIWAEFPLLAEHVKLLPADIINGICSPGKRSSLLRAMEKRGMRQLAYASMQGAEKLFPNHFAYTDRNGRRRPGRLADAYRTTLGLTPRGAMIGTFAAAWDDAGLHNETFWLGWAAMAQGGWTPGAVSVDQTVADFMDVHYGRKVTDMAGVYRDLQSQARFWESLWQRLPSKRRVRPGYGYSGGKRATKRRDMTLLPPALPTLPDLAVKGVYRTRYAKVLAEAPDRLAQSDRLIARLHANVPRAERNRYSLEVFLSLTYFQRSTVEMIAKVAQAEDMLTQAAKAHKAKEPARAVSLLTKAHGRVGEAQARIDRSYRKLVAVWEESRYPRNAAVGGRQFVHVMDDVKDHFADRRRDLSYHTAPIDNIGLDAWRSALAKLVNSYARSYNVKPPALDP